MENEIWKDIPGFEGYQASSLGRIRSITRSKKRKGSERLWTYQGKVLSPSYNHGGYLGLVLGTARGSISKNVHVLVAITFLGPRPEGCEVDHINRIKDDNRVANLRWLPAYENRVRNTKGVKLPLYRNRMENNPRAKRVEVFEGGKLVEILPCAKYITQLFGINYSKVRIYLQKGELIYKGRVYKYEGNGQKNL